MLYGGTVGLKSTAESYLHFHSVDAYPTHNALEATYNHSLHVLKSRIGEVASPKEEAKCLQRQ